MCRRAEEGIRSMTGKNWTFLVFPRRVVFLSSRASEISLK